ncbi:MAG TPA: hypothetical protein VHG33_08900 [Woeseiaceae bacterium]|nr:hypothetical protein [Woeseiaceae bacterium]
MVNHRILRVLVAVAFGLAVAFYAYQRVTDPRPAMQRAREEAVVRASRDILRAYIEPASDLRIVDPLAPDRTVGKVYIYPAEEGGWEVSGHYRRDATDGWHPYLMRLDDASTLIKLSVRDADTRLRRKAAADPKLSIELQEPA